MVCLSFIAVLGLYRCPPGTQNTLCLTLSPASERSAALFQSPLAPQR